VETALGHRDRFGLVDGIGPRQIQNLDRIVEEGLEFPAQIVGRARAADLSALVVQALGGGPEQDGLDMVEAEIGDQVAGKFGDELFEDQACGVGRRRALATRKAADAR
jgi:hypothetical protein